MVLFRTNQVVYAQYRLGLTTQIPINVVYLTDGSQRKIQVGNQKITFKKTSPKNLAVSHTLTSLIIQAIIEKSNESKKVKENIKYAPVWIQKVVRNILKSIDNE